jgi:Asp-tRNA(Asn)/Glu-tRNA(Gln) amidotransferase A subunit family amidase
MNLTAWIRLTCLLFFLAPLCGAQSSSFDPREATIASVHNALYSGPTTCRTIVSSFLTRIEMYNPTINAIITLNPHALSTADEMDMALLAGNVTGSLFCIPVLLKDNYDTFDMPTTGGCADLAGSQPSVDAPAVAALRNAGAIILGKANLHELALEGLSVSSLGGQTVNPYDHTRTPGGSSGGTGAAIATSFAVFGTGTDTVNSLRSPASANSLFSIRPTRGLISRAGIVPISYTQDAIGAIGRTVADVAAALTVMASVGYDGDDNTTGLIPSESVGVDYSAGLYSGSLNGVRLGLLEGFFDRTATNETTPVNDAMDAMVAKLTAAGAVIVPINDSTYSNVSDISAKLDAQQFEYRQELTSYLQRPSLKGSHPETMPAIYRNSKKFLVIPSEYKYVNTALVSSTSNTTYAAVKLGIQNLTLALHSTFTSHNLSAIIYPEQKNLVVKIGSPSQSGRNGILAALTGSPVVTVPAGFSPKTADAPVGVPIGMEILGMPWSEGKILGIAERISEIVHMRRMPQFAEEAVESKAFEAVPKIVPDTRDISKVYPLGTL